MAGNPAPMLQEGVQAMGQVPTYVPPTLSETLLQRKETLEIQLAAVNEAIAKLDANPVIEEFVTLASKSGIY